MLLSKPDIEARIYDGTTKSSEMDAAIGEGKIGFDPGIGPNQIGQTSIDLRLSATFIVIKKLPGITLSPTDLPQIDGLWETHELGKRGDQQESWFLNPGDFVLGMTQEIVHIPYDLAGFVEGRSSYSRVGVSVHQSAPWIHPGFIGPIVLEINNNSNMRVELKPFEDRPCQLSFFCLSTPLSKDDVYGSGLSDIYQHQKHPLKRRNN